MRVCFISMMFAPLVGGSEVQAEKQARQLQSLGHEVMIITLRHERRWKKQEKLEGLPVLRIGGLYRRGGSLRIGKLGQLPIHIGMFLTLWRLRRSYDVIHVFQVSPFATVAVLIGKITHKPTILNIQSAGPSAAQLAHMEYGAMLMADGLTDTDFLKIDPSRNWVIGGGDITFLTQVALGGRLIVNFLRRSNSYYQVLSIRSYSYLTSYGFRAEQIVRIPNGVDTEKFQPALERRPAPSKPERDIICVARLEYAKGVDVLLHAWGRMMREPAEWRVHLRPRLRLVGDGVFKPQMEIIAAELGIQESVEFLGLRTDIVDLLQRSWGFALPSRWEGMPNALLEAMACGLPCVATRVSGSEDIICDGVNGILVEPEDPASLSKALRRIIEDTDLAQRLGEEGQATVVRDYQLGSVVERCLELYSGLFTKDKSSAPFVLEGGRSAE